MQDGAKAAARKDMKRLALTKIEEALRKLQLGKSCSNPEGRGNATETSSGISCGGAHAKQAGEMESYSNSPVVEYASAYPAAFQEDTRDEGITDSKLRTLGDSLVAFDLFPRLLELEESLEQVRGGEISPMDHEANFKRFDKELLELSLKYHSDRFVKKGASEEEMTLARDIETAFNATRCVLKALTDMFLEDIDVEHKYKSYTKLDISLLLGNEDEAEMHAHRVLFKISLATEIKLKTIIVNVRRFLFDAQYFVDSFLVMFSKKPPALIEPGFERYRELGTMLSTECRSTAFEHLERCVTEYRKLHAQQENVETQCRNEKLHICPTIHKMKRDCSLQLRHLEALLELWERPIGEPFPVYNSTLPVDDYFVLPFVFYTVVILSCSLLGKLSSEEDKSSTWFGFSSFMSSLLGTSPNPIVDFDPGDDDSTSVLYGDHEDIVLLYKLALCYGGNRKCSRSVREHFGWGHTSKVIVQGQFLETLTTVQVELESRFRLDDYYPKSSKIHSLMVDVEMKETVQEIREKTKKLKSDIQKIRKNNEYMKKRLDEVLEN